MSAPLTWHNWANLAAYVVNLAVTYSSLTGVFGATNTELSRKYQTILTPAGWAFSIWGPIFIWEGVFAVGQMLPPLRDSKVIRIMTPWWISATAFQCAWTPFFAQEVIVVALICMLGILGSLLGGILAMDYFVTPISVRDFFVLRAPFSLHAGWIVAASLLNMNVYADSLEASPAALLALSQVSLATISVTVVLFALLAPKGDPIIAIVAAWALGAISSNLKDATDLKRQDRFNYYDWPTEVIDGFRASAFVLCLGCLLLAALALGRRLSDSGVKASYENTLPAWP